MLICMRSTGQISSTQVNIQVPLLGLTENRQAGIGGLLHRIFYIALCMHKQYKLLICTPRYIPYYIYVKSHCIYYCSISWLYYDDSINAYNIYIYIYIPGTNSAIWLLKSGH